MRFNNLFIISRQNAWTVRFSGTNSGVSQTAWNLQAHTATFPKMNLYGRIGQSLKDILVTEFLNRNHFPQNYDLLGLINLIRFKFAFLPRGVRIFRKKKSELQRKKKKQIESRNRRRTNNVNIRSYGGRSSFIIEYIITRIKCFSFRSLQ